MEWISYGWLKINSPQDGRTDRTILSPAVRFVRLWAWIKWTFVRFVRFVHGGLFHVGTVCERLRCGEIERFSQTPPPPKKSGEGPFRPITATPRSAPSRSMRLIYLPISASFFWHETALRCGRTSL